MLELHQFRHSPYCLKVRMALAAKKLEYRTVEITPAIGQIDIFKKTGQKKLPVLFDKETIIHDSSSIIRHLEKIGMNTQLIPEDPKVASQALIIENWADTTLAQSIKIVFLEELTKNPMLISSLFTKDISESIKKLFLNIPTKFASKISGLLNQEKKESLKVNLEYLSNLINQNNFIIGETLSVADISVASHISLLKFPNSSGEKLAGKGCSLFKNDPSLQNLFNWRELIEEQLPITNHN